MRLAIVIPALNEAATIGHVVRALSGRGSVIVVDDGSVDQTGDLAESAGAIVVRHSENLGYDAALESGFSKASKLGADIVVTFDADGQHDPELIDLFVEPIRTGGADIVLGSRPKSARFAEAAFNLYTRLRFGVPDILCGLKAYRIELFRRHGRFDRYRSIGTELALASLRRGARFTVVSIPLRPRVSGTTRFGSSLCASFVIIRAMLLAASADIQDIRRT